EMIWCWSSDVCSSDLLPITNVQNRAVLVFISNFKPAAVQGVRIEFRVIVSVVREHVTRAESISNQRPGIGFLAQRNAIVESRQIDRKSVVSGLGMGNG